MQRIAAEEAAGQRVVDMRLDRAGAIEGLAETDHARIGVDAHPDDIGELLGSQRLDRGYLHRHPPNGFSRGRSERSHRAVRIVGGSVIEFCEISQYNSYSPPHDFRVWFSRHPQKPASVGTGRDMATGARTKDRRAMPAERPAIVEKLARRNHTNLAELAYDRLEELIITCALRPGLLLSIQDLQDRDRARPHAHPSGGQPPCRGYAHHHPAAPRSADRSDRPGARAHADAVAARHGAFRRAARDRTLQRLASQ